MIDIDKSMNWWKDNRGNYRDNMGNRDGTDAEEELINNLYAEVKRLREQQQKILRIAETNMALEWGDTDASFEWGYIVDMIKGWTK